MHIVPLLDPIKDLQFWALFGSRLDENVSGWVGTTDLTAQFALTEGRWTEDNKGSWGYLEVDENKTAAAKMASRRASGRVGGRLLRGIAVADCGGTLWIMGSETGLENVGIGAHWK
eukprot:65956-Amorphochlora_amoeboformis.AAC.2